MVLFKSLMLLLKNNKYIEGKAINKVAFTLPMNIIMILIMSKKQYAENIQHIV